MRHEYKHIINYGDYLALKSRLSIFMQTDKHSIDGQYKIRSIYFDDMNDSCYQDKINGVNKRSKYRHHLVEVVAVYPYRKLFAVMLVFEVDALGNGLLLEKVVFFIDE